MSESINTEATDVRLSERDVAILQALNEFQCMKSSQIRRLIFPDNHSTQSVRRRLKHLLRNKLIKRTTPYNKAPETAYFLGKAGADILKKHGIIIHRWDNRSKIKSQAFQQILSLTDFRISLDLATKHHSHLSVTEFISGNRINAQNNERELISLFTHSANKQQYHFQPSALFVAKWEDDKTIEKKMFFAEIDNGSQSIESIRNKVVAYSLFAKQKLYKKYGTFDSENPFLVLLLTTESRKQKIRAALVDQENSSLIWIGDKNQVTPETILHSPIWVDSNNVAKSLIRQD